MREIKFRAWDKLTQKYWNIENWHFEDEYLDLIESGVSIADPNSERVWRKFNEVEIMQYTGLKDVNGVEIYEWDIVRVNYSGNDDFSGLALVVFINGCFELEGKIMEIINSEGIMYDDFYAISNDLSRYSACVKVIGNKFKNPKLLEVAE